MYTKIDLDTWNRKEHFNFFMTFEEPFHGIMTQMDVSNIKQGEDKIPFTTLYMYYCIKAVNETPAFKLRIEENLPVKYHNIDMGMTVLRENGAFAYIRIKYEDSIEVFHKNFRNEIQELEHRKSLFPNDISDGMIHGSILPWIKFSGLSHARKFTRIDCIPKITFGKVYYENEKHFMPISVHVHHALADGKDVADFISHFQNLINNA